MTAALLDAPVVLSIGEPWDFSSPDGENRLVGRIKEVMSPAVGGTSLRLQVTSFQLAGAWINELIAKCRHVGEEEMVAVLTSKGEIMSNFYNPKQLEFILAGSLQLTRRPC